MLPARNRLRTAAEFAAVGRARPRRRASGALLTVQLARSEANSDVRVGISVPKACGPAVTRNRIKRRIREAMRTTLCSLPAGTMVVVRAHPQAGKADFHAMSGELTSLLGRAQR